MGLGLIVSSGQAPHFSYLPHCQLRSLTGEFLGFGGAQVGRRELGFWCQGPSFIPLPAYLLCNLGKPRPFSEAQFSHLRRDVMTTSHRGLLTIQREMAWKLQVLRPTGIFLAGGVSLFCWAGSSR